MLYQPKFCCDCGEKIERVDWKIFTSRRFCQLCETEHKLLDYAPRAIVAVGLLIGIFGLGSHLQSAQTSRQFVPERKLAGRQANPDRVAEPNLQATNAPVTKSQNNLNGEVSNLPANVQPARKIVEKANVQPAEQVFYCGAATKKGTPCSRRVKGSVRCWQHQGMPVMREAESTSERN